MYICNRCGCRCDAGELRGGVCDDCLEEERHLEARREQDRIMREHCIMEQSNGQLALILGGYEIAGNPV